MPRLQGHRSEAEPTAAAEKGTHFRNEILRKAKVSIRVSLTLHVKVYSPHSTDGNKVVSYDDVSSS